MVLGLLMAIACDTEAPVVDPRLLDQQHYQQAMAETDPQRAVALCEQIEDVPLRGECVVFEAGELLRAGGDGYSACGRLENSDWQSVCYFEMVDAGKLRGERALRTCQRTGAFVERCLAHALQREENELSQQFPAGQEAELQAHIRGMLQRYGLGEHTEEKLDVTIAGRIIADRFRRGPGLSEPFERAACGSADDAACVEAYRVLVLRAGGQGRVPEDCEPPIQVEQVAAMGLPVWSADAQAIGDAVWLHLCRRQNSQHNAPPDAQSAARAQSPPSGQP